MDQMRLVNYQSLPNININKTVDTGTKIFDENGGYVLKILGKDDNGQVIATKYQLVDVTNVEQLKLPELKSIEGMDGEEIHLTPLTQELIGPGMFHIQDANVHTIETAINIVLKDLTIQDSNMNAIVEYFKKFTPDQLKKISQNISDMLSDNYYDKKHSDEFETNIRTRMNNLEAKFPDEPLNNGYFPPNYTGKTDNENPDLSAKLRRMKNELEAYK